jgi:hypothetical protein
MRTKLLLSGLATLAAALTLSAPAPVPAPAASPGPGGVLSAVQGFLRALDMGDREYLTKAIVDSHHAVTWTFDEKGSEAMGDGQDAASSFFDVAFDGREFRADGRQVFLDRALDALGSSQKAGRLVMSRVKSVQASCASEHCSYAVIEFDRIAASDSGEIKMPMRATALFRYDSSQPNFKLMHWHASPAQVQTLLPGDDK